jgi:hypothetical protein
MLKIDENFIYEITQLYEEYLLNNNRISSIKAQNRIFDNVSGARQFLSWYKDNYENANKGD